jgi:hypothetical protein
MKTAKKKQTKAQRRRYWNRIAGRHHHVCLMARRAVRRSR